MDWSEEFALDPDLVYLNHAAVAPWPLRAGQAVARFAAENTTTGAYRYPAWLAVEQRVRDLFAGLINTQPENISLLKNTSEGLSLVAYGLDLQAGDEIVGIADDFPSNRIVWQSLESGGVRFVGCRLEAHDPDPEETIIAAVTANTRLIAVSSVHYATGLRLDLGRIGRFCRTRDILFCVDAIQSLGVVPLDVAECGADFIAADGHKWLLGPEGVALFYCRPELRTRLRLHEYGWHMTEDPTDFTATSWRLADNGRRFECGSPNMLGLHAMAESLELITSTGVDNILINIERNIDYLIDITSDTKELGAITPASRERRAGIFSLLVERCNPDLLWRQLMDMGIVCAARGGYLRFSPHAYTQQYQLDRAIAALRGLLR